MVQIEYDKSDIRSTDDRNDTIHERNTYSVLEVPSHLIPTAWPLSEAYIQKAIDEGLGEAPISVIYNRLLNRNMQLWVVYKSKQIVGSFITQIEVNPNFYVLQIVHAGGEHFKEWVGEALTEIEKMALREGCEYIQAHGRRGWHKYAKENQFNETYRVYSKRIRHG